MYEYDEGSQSVFEIGNARGQPGTRYHKRRERAADTQGREHGRRNHDTGQRLDRTIDNDDDSRSENVD